MLVEKTQESQEKDVRDQKEKERLWEKRYRENLTKHRPWIKHFYGAKSRCNYKTTGNYSRYGGKGILFILTKDEIFKLWIRDGASKMKNPCIHRLDKFGNYEFDNCQFVDRSVHQEKDKGIKVKATTKSGIVMYFNSYRAAEREINGSSTHISMCVRNIQKTHKGMIWERV
jgi:hypothetical protein